MPPPPPPSKLASSKNTSAGVGRPGSDIDGSSGGGGCSPSGSSPSYLACDAGVIPRAVSTVLADASARREQGWEFVLTATYVEIYNERIRDLLEPANDNLKARPSYVDLFVLFL